MRDTFGDQYFFIGHLARSLWNGRTLAAVLTAYGDASGDASTRCLTVCANVAEIEQWEDFRSDWQCCLDDFQVANLHMKELCHFQGQYAKWHDVPGDVDRIAFLSRCVGIASRRIYASFARTVETRHYVDCDKAYRLSEEFGTPYALAGYACILSIEEWRMEHHPDVPIIYLFEKGDDGQAGLRNLAERNLGVTVCFKKKTECLEFQLADFAAYESGTAATRFLYNETPLELKDYRRSGQKLFDSLATDWGRLEGRLLPMICAAIPISKRPSVLA